MLIQSLSFLILKKIKMDLMMATNMITMNKMIKIISIQIVMLQIKGIIIYLMMNLTSVVSVYKLLIRVKN